MKILIKNGRLVDAASGLDRVGDLAIAAGRIVALGEVPPDFDAQRVIDAALQMHGGLGVMVGSKVESLYRDIRSLRIYEGATEVQQLIIGKHVLAMSAAAAANPGE